MQPNIAMKFAGYVAWILLQRRCKFGEKNYYNSRDIEFFLGDYFFGAPCRYSELLLVQLKRYNFDTVEDTHKLFAPNGVFGVCQFNGVI